MSSYGERCSVLFPIHHSLSAGEEGPTLSGSDKRTIDVAHPSNRVVNFGAVWVGQTQKRTVTLVNCSPANVDLQLTTSNFISEELSTDGIFDIRPSKVHFSNKGEKKEITLKLTPKTRLPGFNEKVYGDLYGVLEPIFAIQGSCQDYDISLDSVSIPFGAVVIKSKASRRLQLHNKGDIGAKFEWNVEKFKPDFSIQPIKGYISPGSDVSFIVTFQPTKVSPDIRYSNLSCSLEGTASVPLTLTGVAISCQPQREVINFLTNVRSSEKKSIQISNKTNNKWELRPVINGQHWSGADTMVVGPMQTLPYELIYRPLTTVKDNKKLAGSVFFALPDGSGLLYNISGGTDPPRVVDTLTRDVNAKNEFILELKVKNWLKQPQRFKCEIEMLKPEKLDSSTYIQGLDYIDVPGLGTRTYKLKFFSHREFIYNAKVVFLNETTREFQWYNVTFIVGPSEAIDRIELQAASRQTVSHSLTMANPLNVPVSFMAFCPANDVMIPSQFTVPPQAKGTLSFDFMPLKAGEVETKIQMTSNELGVFTYELFLSASEPRPEKAVYFSTSLGGSVVQQVKFVTYTKQKTEFTTRVTQENAGGAEWTCEKSLTAAPSSSGGTTITLDVQFEPSRTGESRGTLLITHPLGGDYVFPLFGTCIQPKPSGPYLVRTGSTVVVQFKNVFHSQTSFIYNIDNPLFSVKKGDNLKPKRTAHIQVGYDGNPDKTSKTISMAKLTVSCSRSSTGKPGGLTWTFYIKGTPKESTLQSN